MYPTAEEYTRQAITDAVPTADIVDTLQSHYKLSLKDAYVMVGEEWGRQND